MQPTPMAVQPEPRESGQPACQTVLDRETCGCLHLSQRLVTLLPGESWRTGDGVSEELLFVIDGSGEIEFERETVHRLRPESAVLVPPGEQATFRCGEETLRMLSVVSPRLGEAPTVPPSPKKAANPTRMIGAAGSETETASEERKYKLLINPRYGSRYVTQFMGFIEQSKAPAHKHTYEEVIYVLGGTGVAHLETGSFGISAGSCIYLPAGSVHCLENPHPEHLRLVGVFCPSGSPAENYE